MSWHKICFFDDWGNLSVVYGDAAKQLVSGNHKIKWPDGSEKAVDISFHQNLAEIQGRGEPYTVTRQEPYVTVYWRGLKFWLSLINLLRDHELFIWTEDPVQQENVA